MTNQERRERLSEYRTAEKAILANGQSITTSDGETFTRANLPTLVKAIERMEKQLNGGPRIRRIRFV